MKVKILSKNGNLSEQEKYFVICDDVNYMTIGNNNIVFRRNDETLYRAEGCSKQQTFNIQLSAEKGEIIDLTELNVERYDSYLDEWVLI